ncbi:putative methyltransferase-domain-containing protein [Globomyces pollinis-pini]|nr:putative methyltransferase-domain-containing protein [Globomyces pollinis-pini]
MNLDDELDLNSNVLDTQHLDILSPNGLPKLQKYASPFLVRLLSNPPKDVLDESEFMDTVASLLSLLCGKLSSSGHSVSKFEFKNAGVIEIRETSFTEAEIGFQTWGAGILMAKMIDENILKVQDKDILELGSGTGITSLVCGRMGAKSVIMTDFHPVVIENALINIDKNQLSDKIRCLKLDWSWCEDQENCFLNEEDIILRNTNWKMIIAADCVYDPSHARLVPKVAKHYLSKDSDARFHICVTHRLQFMSEVEQFEKNMINEGWILEEFRWTQKHALKMRYCIYKLQ